MSEPFDPQYVYGAVVAYGRPGVAATLDEARALALASMHKIVPQEYWEQIRETRCDVPFMGDESSGMLATVWRYTPKAD